MIAPPDDFADLRAYSARIGAEATLVQAAGGNTSVKDGERMWIKASGIWLAEVMQREGFVAVDLARLRADMAEAPERTEDPKPYALDPSAALRPSIETTLHGIMPQRVVIHVHHVDTIARLCVVDTEACRRALDDVPGVFPALLGYARPGRPLTAAVRERLAPLTNTLLLGNHGLVVAAETVPEAAALLDRVTTALRLPVRAAAPRDPAHDTTWHAAGYLPAAEERVHAVATDPNSLTIASAGSLYPDHVIFLGRGLRVAHGPDELDTNVPIVADPGHGVYLKADLGRAGHALAGCLADVARRVQGTPSPLRREDEDALLGWDAEKHRQALERASAARS